MRFSGTLFCLGSGSGAALTVGSALLGELRPGELRVAGASILATVEPLVTVLLAFLVFGERLGVVQPVGGALVLAAVLVLNARRPGWPPAGMPARAGA
jgi:uncharacterized membrane protein